MRCPRITPLDEGVRRHVGGQHLSYVLFFLVHTHSTGAGFNTRLAGPEHGIASSIITMINWRSSIRMGKGETLSLAKSVSPRNTCTGSLLDHVATTSTTAQSERHLLASFIPPLLDCLGRHENTSEGLYKIYQRRKRRRILLLSFRLYGPLRGPGMGSLPAHVRVNIADTPKSECLIDLLDSFCNSAMRPEGLCLE